MAFIISNGMVDINRVSFTGITWYYPAGILAILLAVLVLTIYIRKSKKDIPITAEEKQTGVGIIEKLGMVTQTIDNEKHTGRVLVNGTYWRAISRDGDILGLGETIRVKSVSSFILTVIRPEKTGNAARKN